MKYSPEAEENLEKLNNYIPSTAEATVRLIKRENQECRGLEVWREQQLISFLKCIVETAADLDHAFRRRRISTVAWLTRNLLELSIWTRYCNLSNEKAKAFRDDAIKDFYGIYRALEALPSLEAQHRKSYFAELAQSTLGNHEAAVEISAMGLILDDALAQLEPSSIRQQLSELAEGTGLPDSSVNFTKIHVAALEVGCADFFSKQNKILSKFAHPSALSVMSKLHTDDLGLDMFLNDGTELAVLGVCSIIQFISKKPS